MLAISVTQNVLIAIKRTGLEPLSLSYESPFKSLTLGGLCLVTFIVFYPRGWGANDASIQQDWTAILYFKVSKTKGRDISGGARIEFDIPQLWAYDISESACSQAAAFTIPPSLSLSLPTKSCRAREYPRGNGNYLAEKEYFFSASRRWKSGQFFKFSQPPGLSQ